MFKPLAPEQRIKRLLDASYIGSGMSSDDDPYFFDFVLSSKYENDYPDFCNVEKIYTKLALESHGQEIVEALQYTCTAARRLWRSFWLERFVEPMELRFVRGLCKPPSLTQVEQRMLFYAGLMNRGVCKLGREDMKEWRMKLPLAIEGQHLCLDQGDLPVKMSLQNVRGLKRLAESDAGREKRMRSFQHHVL